MYAVKMLCFWEPRSGMCRSVMGKSQIKSHSKISNLLHWRFNLQAKSQIWNRISHQNLESSNSKPQIKSQIPKQQKGFSIVPGVSHVKKCDWLVKNMTDWRLEVDLGQLNDWRRLAVSMTGGSDFASTLLFVTVSPMQCTTSSVVLQLLLHVVNTLFRDRA